MRGLMKEGDDLMNYFVPEIAQAPISLKSHHYNKYNRKTYLRILKKH
jgi:hypothetical protein